MVKNIFIAGIALFTLLVSGCATPPCHTRPTPPPPRVEIISPPPHAHMVWIPGHWAWNGKHRGHVWIPGHWAKRP